MQPHSFTKDFVSNTRKDLVSKITTQVTYRDAIVILTIYASWLD